MADEEAQPLAVAQVQDVEGEAGEGVLVGLEELVARVGLEDVQQRLAVVRAGPYPRALDQPAHLAPEQRDVAGRAVVGAGGEQAQEPVLADDAAVRGVAFDPDVIEIRVAVDRRAGVGLGEDQRLARIGGALADHRRQLGEGLRGRLLEVLEDALAVLGLALEVEAVGAAHQRVAAVAEKGEVVRGEPLQKGHDLLGHLGVHPRARRVEVGTRLLDRLEHRVPVLHRGAHVGEDVVELVGEVAQLSVVAELVDLEAHEAFLRAVAGALDLEEATGLVPVDEQDGVDQQMDGEPTPGERRRHAVDEKRHVVGDDGDDGVGRMPTVALQLGVVDPQAMATGGAIAGEAVVIERGGVEGERIARQEIGARGAGIVKAHEALGLQRVVAAEPLLQLLA